VTASATSTGEAEGALAWERRNALAAGAAAIAAGLLTIVGAVLTAITLSDKPAVTVFDALRDAGGRPPRSGGLKTATARFVHDHAAALTIGQVLTALGGLLAAAALAYLFVAARARRPGMPQWGLAALAVGGVAFFVGAIVPQVAVDVTTSSFIGSADHSTVAAHDALQPTTALAGALIGYVGTLALAIGFVVCAVNAMRVGLLTRFVGALGIVSGALWVIPLASLPVIQAFWLIALGVIFLRVIPSAVPPAWTSGQAEPWPTRQQQLEARAGTRARADGDDAAAAGPTPAPRAKKKRRRR
jgi:hypothetical protein